MYILKDFRVNCSSQICKNTFVGALTTLAKIAYFKSCLKEFHLFGKLEITSCIYQLKNCVKINKVHCLL